MDSSRVLFWLQGGSGVMEREEPGCGKPEPGMTRLTTGHGSCGKGESWTTASDSEEWGTSRRLLSSPVRS